ncbi:MAG: uracil-DNA glycosylase [Kiritimatiellae bacterium]|nr:uracil-DNA glycosylase [Kiritimatiellia bacterium]
MAESESKVTASLDEVLADLSAYIEYQVEEEVGTEPISPEVLTALSRPENAFERTVPDAPLESAAVDSVTERTAQLAAIAREVAACTQCPLHRSRSKTVPGQGNPHPEIVFVGGGPLADDDESGVAFSGRAGLLLTRMIAAMGFAREDVFICNVVKCRPPENRAPAPQEMSLCLPFLKQQLNVLAPKAIVALGATALNGLVVLPEDQGITKVRGSWLRFEGVDVMPTFHPDDLLINAKMKKYVWEDLKSVLRKLGRPIPPVRKA